MSSKKGDKEPVARDYKNRLVEHDCSLFGVLADAVTRDVDDEEWDKIRQKAWNAAAEDGEV